jgi:hypothetical protein
MDTMDSRAVVELLQALKITLMFSTPWAVSGFTRVIAFTPFPFPGFKS